MKAAAHFANCVQTVGIVAALQRFLDADGRVIAPMFALVAGQAQIRNHASDALATAKFSHWRVITNHRSPDADVLVQIGNWQQAQQPSDSGWFVATWQTNSKHEATLRSLLLTTDKSFQPAADLDQPSAQASSTIAGQTGNVLTLAEIQFGGICGSSGMSSAFDVLAADKVQVVRSGGSFVGRERAVNDPRIKAERWLYIPQQSAIDAKHEVAYVFGRYTMTTTSGQTERGYYARIWKPLPGKDKLDSANWRVVVDAATPLSRQ